MACTKNVGLRLQEGTFRGHSWDWPLVVISYALHGFATPACRRRLLAPGPQRVHALCSSLRAQLNPACCSIARLGAYALYNAGDPTTNT